TEAPKAEEKKPEDKKAEAAAPEAPAPRVTLIRNGTLLTVTRGVIPNGSILVRDGKIQAIGPAKSIDPQAPRDARVIDATGKWVMPGIIDSHSHMAIEGGINEGTYVITPEVRVRDVVNPKDVTIYRALAGGVTTAHIMHGSANAIGGQNAIIKLKWGRSVAEMVPPDAPRTVKFALGENPKRSNFTAPPATQPRPQAPDTPGTPGSPRRAATPRPPLNLPRYPTTRMGVENVLRECFTAAKAYQAEWDAYDRAVAGGEKRTPPRRDLRLEALSDIARGRILVEAHCYRSDEILMLLRVAEEFGFKIRTLHHALEAYKVAPEIAKHGCGVSTFSDWWAYKMEAYDAIPYNAALCAKAGIPVSVNSDSNEQVRRLYWEAAKTMKYGDMPEADALKAITLWPAWQIGMDHRIGSLDVGKDADIAIFSAHPFSPTAVCELTLVEGQVYFDRKRDLQLRGKPGYPAPDAEAALNIGSDDGCGDGE
ncbi:MAG TPA: amidohydrolase family protein, partial [Armatimonadota bacterium]|nr:amidohydrolase family protein [Armatimonadota bacterium]